ncbi:RT0821/Lpp0805 family surface protein [Phreatobacter stygius]|nr:RT0821/Lpp0805 family surface protein [Phreatobacter stygius]
MRIHPCDGRLARLVAMAVALMTLPGCAVTLPSLWERTQTPPPAAQAPQSAETATAETPASPAPLSLAAVGQTAQPTDPITTGSIRRSGEPVPPTAAAGALPIPEGDWQAAKRVLLEALADRADTPSIPWENSQSGMRGTVTALQRVNGTAGQTCRDFLGSAIKDGKEVWFDGRACRTTGAWAVLELRPWRRS